MIPYGQLRHHHRRQTFYTDLYLKFVNFPINNHSTVRHLGIHWCFAIKICFLPWNEIWGLLGRLLFAIAIGLGREDLRSIQMKYRGPYPQFHYMDFHLVLKLKTCWDFLQYFSICYEGYFSVHS